MLHMLLLMRTGKSRSRRICKRLTPYYIYRGGKNFRPYIFFTPICGSVIYFGLATTGQHGQRIECQGFHLVFTGEGIDRSQKTDATT